MSTRILIPAVLVAGLGLSIGCRGGHAASGLPGDMLAAKLKLSDGQKTAIHDAFRRHKPALAARMAEVVEARNAAMDAGMDPAVTPEAWRVQQERLASAVYDMAKEVRGTYLEALPVLSGAQKTEALGMLKKFHAHMEGMHGRHHAFALRFLKGRLDLTDAQSTAIQTTLDHHKTALGARREALHQAMAAAVELAADPAASQTALDQQFAAVKEAGMALSTEVRSAYLEVYAQLTPDQREGAKELAKDFRNAVDGVRKLALGF